MDMYAVSDLLLSFDTLGYHLRSNVMHVLYRVVHSALYVPLCGACVECC